MTDELTITHIRLCACGKPAGHDGECLPDRKRANRPDNVPIESQRVSTILPKIKQALLDLELVSHAPTASLDRVSRDTSGSIGGNKPSGGDHDFEHDLTTDERLSRESSYLAKTTTSYARAVERIIANQRLTADQRETKLADLLADIEDTIRSWRFAPSPQGIEPERGTFYWKCMVADDNVGTAQHVAHRHSVSRRTVFNYRRRYRGLMGSRESGRI